MFFRMEFLVLVFTLTVFIVISPPVQSAAVKYNKNPVTLDPDTLRQVIEKLRATSESSEIKPAVPVEEGASEIVFQETNFVIGTRSQAGIGKPPNSVTAVSGDDNLVFEDDLPPRDRIGTARSTSTLESHKCSNSKHRYHLASGKCYPIGKLGAPCGENMIFYPNDDDAVYGTCDCAEHPDIPLVFHPGTGKCYEIYGEAYCSKSEWLVFDSLDNPVCEARKCPAGEVLFHERCVKLEASDPDCKKSEKIVFHSDDLTPSCGLGGSTSAFSNLSGPKLKCRPGSSQDIVGRCRQKIKFNING